MNHRLKRHSIFSLPLCLAMVLSFATKAVAQTEEEDPASAGAPTSAAPVSPQDASTAPGEMNAEQLFINEGKPTEEVISDGPRKGVTAQTKGGDVEMKGVSDLANLSEFKDIAVIQKRYLPKTKRFEGFGGLNAILNDKFFLTFGLNGRVAYFFNERWAVEGVLMALSTGEKSVTKGLKDRGVLTTNFVSPTTYYGADVRWQPVYGKMSLINRRITPFDLYFSAGMGITNTNQGGSEPTIHLGTGQVFAITKSAAFRWDFSWNFYSARSGVAGAQQNSTYNNLYLTVGASFFFPEATYR